MQQQWRDQSDAWLRETIRKHGWAVQSVLGNHRKRYPDFSYTVGLWGFGHPELLVIGLAADVAGWLLNQLGQLVRAGESLRAGQSVYCPNLRGGSDLQLRRVPNPHEILFVAQNVYSGPGLRKVPALQVCYPDSYGRYPWEPGYADTRWLQPPPGRFAA
ncbi:MAG TPA: DUF4262 domain-containing protein [Jatrophihabitantaceae bacterium]|nr:DUF4262 domain-containing protein [Jatrophihabitantaceae bacterium]